MGTRNRSRAEWQRGGFQESASLRPVLPQFPIVPRRKKSKLNENSFRETLLMKSFAEKLIISVINSKVNDLFLLEI